MILKNKKLFGMIGNRDVLSIKIKFVPGVLPGGDQGGSHFATSSKRTRHE